MSRLAAWLMKCRTQKRYRPRLSFVTLEDRITPANFVVSNTLDAGPGSLRDAVISANGAAGADTIFFTTTGLITLTTVEIAISGPLTINGNGISVSGNGARRIFNTDSAPTDTVISVNFLNLTSGKATGRGGAVFIGDETVSFNDCSFSNNSSTDDGGAINVQSGGTLNLNRSIISGNTAASDGGGIYFFQDGDGTIANSSIVNNKATAGTGGGFYFFGTVTTGAAFKFQNATISGNSSGSSGGGIFLTSFTGALTVQNSTITNNTAAINSGGGIIRNSGSGTIAIESSIVSGNVNAAAPDISSTGTVTINNSAYGSATGFTPTGSGNLVGQNLKLAPLADNGGQFGSGLLTHAFDAASPLIDKGSNVAGLSTDARGNFRQNGTADIGAVEMQSVVASTSDSGIASLREAVLDANRFPGANTIAFDATAFTSAKTISLASPLSIKDTVTINGPAQSLTIDGNNATQLFTVNIAAASSTVTMKNLTLTKGKSAAQGGAIRVEDEALNLDTVTISNSTAASSGGGIFLNTNGSLALTNSTISGNSAGTNGGGVYFFQNGGLSVSTSAIVNNNATGKGGGLYFFGTANLFQVFSATISGNTAGTSGGGIDFVSFSSGAPGYFSDATIVNNRVISGNGGGIARESGAGTIELINSIVSGNSATANVDISGGMTIGGSENAIGTTAGFTPAFAGNNILNQPHTTLKLRALANNGGPTLTHAFEFDSPLRNAGFSASSTDQRGFIRNNGGVDIGAFELNTLVTNANDTGGGSLRAAIEENKRVVGVDTITFESAFFSTAKTIALGSTLSITEAATINGPGARFVTLSGNNAVQILNTAGAPASSAITISGLTLSNGKSAFGPALAFSNQSITIRDCAILGNKATDTGNIFGSTLGGSLLLERSTVSGNSAAVDGGAIFLGNGVGLTMRNTTLANNTAGFGGAISLVGGTHIIQNSTIFGNKAAIEGGGMILGAGAVLNVESSIISGNTAPINADISSGTVNAKNSAIGSNAGFTFNNQGGNLAFGTNLKLATLVDNGGPVNTIGFAFDSPLRSAGSNLAGLATDARGLVRVSGAATDIGALEMQETVFNTNDAGSGSLRESILDSNRFTATNTIIFDPTVFATAKTILLSSELNATDAMIIVGPPTVGVTVSGKADLFENFRVLNVATALPGAAFTLSNMTLTKGRRVSPEQGAGINAGAHVLNLIDVTVSSNVVQANGAGIYFGTSGGTLNLTRGTITSNSGTAGSGVYFNGGGSLTILDSAVTGNSAFDDAGGIYMNGAAPVFNIRNSTISGNSANSDGGGIYLNNFTGTALIRNSTVVGNTAKFGSGGGIKRNGTGTLTIDSTIVSGNTASNGFDIVAGGTVNVNFSAIGNNIGFAPTGANNLAFGTNLKLGALANNGGPTLTHLPASDSPLLGKGSNVTSLTTDQRGLPRSSGTVDIGSVEVQSLPTVSSLVINDGTAQRSRLTKVVVNFSSPVNAAAFGATTFTRTTPNDALEVGTGNGVILSQVTGFTSSLTITFSNIDTAALDYGSLADGRWQLAIPSLGYSSTVGDTQLRRLFGDIDANGTVDATDLSFFPAFGAAAASPFDFNNNGDIDSGTDLAQFGNRFGLTL